MKPYPIHFFFQCCFCFIQSLGQLLSFLVDKENIYGLKLNAQGTSIGLFQIGTSEGALLIQNKGPSPALNDFLTSHTFYMRGGEEFYIMFGD